MRKLRPKGWGAGRGLYTRWLLLGRGPGALAGCVLLVSAGPCEHGPPRPPPPGLSGRPEPSGAVESKLPSPFPALGLIPGPLPGEGHLPGPGRAPLGRARRLCAVCCRACFPPALQGDVHTVWLHVHGLRGLGQAALSSLSFLLCGIGHNPHRTRGPASEHSKLGSWSPSSRLS